MNSFAGPVIIISLLFNIYFFLVGLLISYLFRDIEFETFYLGISFYWIVSIGLFLAFSSIILLFKYYILNKSRNIFSTLSSVLVGIQLLLGVLYILPLL